MTWPMLHAHVHHHKHVKDMDLACLPCQSWGIFVLTNSNCPWNCEWVFTTKDHMSRFVIPDALKSKPGSEVGQLIRHHNACGAYLPHAIVPFAYHEQTQPTCADCGLPLVQAKCKLALLLAVENQATASFWATRVCQSDNGREFDNQLFPKLCKLVYPWESVSEIQSIKGANCLTSWKNSAKACRLSGAAQNTHRLRAQLRQPTRWSSANWPAALRRQSAEMLPGILWAMNTVPHSAHHKSLYQMVFGRKPRKQILIIILMIIWQ